MPVTPKSLARLRKPLTFDYLGDDAAIEYYPGVFQAGLIDRWNAFAERGQAAAKNEDAAEIEAVAQGYCKLMCEMLASWDYCEDPAEEDGPPGPPIPLTPERLLEEFNKYPLTFPAFLVAIIEAIAKDMNQGKPSGAPSSAPSGATSSPTAVSTSSPVGASRKKSRSSSRRAGSVAVAQR